MQLLSTLPAEEVHSTQIGIFQHGALLPVQLVEDMEVFGAVVSSSGDPLRPVMHRLAKAASAYWALSSVLRCTEVSLRRRSSEYTKRIQPIALYGSGAWVWSRSVCR